MAIPVATAINNPALEVAVLSAVSDGSRAVVARRCVEIADLLAIAEAGLVQVVVLSVDVSGLDLAAIEHLRSCAVAVICIRQDGDLPISRSWPVDVLDAGDLAGLPELIRAAASRAGSRDAGPRQPADSAWQQSLSQPHSPRTVIAVWGPTGAPGRSTVALALADESARRGVPTMLIDADVYGGAIAPMLGLLDEAPGAAAACRASADGTLDVRSLARLAVQINDNLRVLTGISRVDRWPELRGAALEHLVATAGLLVPVVVIDCGFSIEQDEELTYDTIAPQRNAATLAALRSATRVVMVSASDPVGIARGVRALHQLGEVLPEVRPVLVANRLRSSVVRGADARGQVQEVFTRFAGVPVAHFLPDDPAAADAALASGRTLGEAAPRSSLRQACISLLAELVPAPASANRRARARSGA